MDTPPEPFEALTPLGRHEDPITRAKNIGEALNAIPDLQKWLRRIRQQAVLQANHDGKTYAEIGHELGISGPRANAIAHNSPTGSGSGRPPGRPKKPSSGSP